MSVRSIREIQEATRGARRGTIRGGEEKDGKPVRRETWLLTSPDRAVLEAISFGGPVVDFASERSNDRFARDTETNELRVLLSAYGDPLSQRYELYGSGGLIRNCDGETCATVDPKTGEMVDQPCICSEESRECKLATRLSVVLVDAVTFGSWLLTTGSENAAYELRFAVNMLMGAAARGANVPAVLRLEQRTVKKQGEKFPRRFAVPVLDADALAVKALEAGAAGQVREIGAPASAPENGGDRSLPADSDESDPPGDTVPTGKSLTKKARDGIFAFAREQNVPEYAVRAIAQMQLDHGVSEMTTDEVDRLRHDIEFYAGSNKAQAEVSSWIVDNAPYLLPKSDDEKAAEMGLAPTTPQGILAGLKAKDAPADPDLPG